MEEVVDVMVAAGKKDVGNCPFRPPTAQGVSALINPNIPCPPSCLDALQNMQGCASVINGYFPTLDPVQWQELQENIERCEWNRNHLPAFSDTPAEIARSCFVTWTESSDEIPAGDIGQITWIEDDGEYAWVDFRPQNGREFRGDQLLRLDELVLTPPGSFQNNTQCMTAAQRRERILKNIRWEGGDSLQEIWDNL
jgi:hypothetical protein